MGKGLVVFSMIMITIAGVVVVGLTASGPSIIGDLLMAIVGIIICIAIMLVYG